MERQTVALLNLRMCWGCSLHRQETQTAQDGSQQVVNHCDRRDCDNYSGWPVAAADEDAPPAAPDVYRGEDD